MQKVLLVQGPFDGQNRPGADKFAAKMKAYQLAQKKKPSVPASTRAL